MADSSTPERQQPAANVPEALIEERKSRWAPLVWLVPVIALGIAGWLAVKGIINLGTGIEITFASGEGLEAGRTRSSTTTLTSAR